MLSHHWELCISAVGDHMIRAVFDRMIQSIDHNYDDTVLQVIT